MQNTQPTTNHTIARPRADDHITQPHHSHTSIHCWQVEKKEYAPRVPDEMRGRMTDPSKINGRISIGFMIFGCASENGVSVSRWECCRRLQSERGLKIHQAKVNANGRWRNSVLVQLCFQVKRRTIPDRIHSTVPSAFEFPASR